MDQPKLETERLMLREYNLGDAAEVCELAGNPRVSATTLNVPFPYTSKMAIDWIGAHKERWNKREEVIYAITIKKTSQVIGAVSLVSIKGNEAELGYWIGEQYWRKGYCTEAVKALIDLAITELKITKIIAEHLSSNPASGKVMQKSGLLPTGSLMREDRNGNMAKIEIYAKKYT